MKVSQAFPAWCSKISLNYSRNFQMISCKKSRKLRIAISLACIALCHFFAPLCLAEDGKTKDKQTKTETADAPIRLGLLASLTGPGKEPNEAMVNAFRLYLDQIHASAGGRRIELIFADDETKGSKASLLAKRLIESDKVDILCGIYWAAVASAVAPIAEEHRVPLVISISGLASLTQRDHKRYVIRTGWTPSQFFQPLGQYAAKDLRFKKIICLASDYSLGYEIVGSFQDTFEANGGEIIQKLWLPIDATDMSPYFAGIRTKDADAIFITTAGKTAATVAEQLRTAGCTLPILGHYTLFDEQLLTDPAHARAVSGGYSPCAWSGTLATPANKAFMSAYEKKFGKRPGYEAEMGYTNAKWICTAIDNMKGNIGDSTKLMNALRHVVLKDDPRGKLKMDDHGMVIQNCYIRQAKKVSDRYENVIVHTYPMCSQFWNRQPEEFLALPPYSKNYPPCPHCLK
jgi:branched-chain amino acid transport system substrate-binding protein